MNDLTILGHRHPDAGRPQLPRPRRRGRLRGRPAARHRPGRWTCSTSTACGSPHVFETHIHNDYVTGGLALARAHRRGVPRERRRRGLLRAHPGPRRRGGRGRRPDARHRARHARATPSPTCPTRSPTVTTTRGRGGGLLRRLAAVRRHRPPRPARRRAHPRPGPSPARLRAPAGRPAARRGRGLPDPRLRLVLLRDPVRGDRVDHRAGEAGQPGADPGRGDLRPRAARRPRCLAGVLRPHGAGQRRRPLRARPEPARRSPTPTSCAAASRPASGSSTCATARPSPPGTSAAR